MSEMAMNEGPMQLSGYDPKRTAMIRRTCLEVATRLQDFQDVVCVVGGLVPSLLVDSAKLVAAESHIGTYDLDLGLSLAILQEERYEEIAQRLRDAGFSIDHNEAGNPTAQRWRSREGALIDFLIAPAASTDTPGRVRNLEPDVAAVITPGLHLAFQDREVVELAGETLSGGTAARTISVCGPGAFVVLKALAFGNRGKEKDAYDLWYVIRNRRDTLSRLRIVAGDPDARRAIKVLADDFSEAARIGPERVARFLLGRADVNLQADVAGLVRDLGAGVGEF